MVSIIHNTRYVASYVYSLTDFVGEQSFTNLEKVSPRAKCGLSSNMMAPITSGRG